MHDQKTKTRKAQHFQCHLRVFQGPVVIPKQKSLPSQQVAKCKFRASLAGFKSQSTLPETNIFAPEKLAIPKGKDRIPTMNFHVRTVSLR